MATTAAAINPFDLFKTHETNSAIAQKEGEEPMFYPCGANGRPLENKFQLAWWQWTNGNGVFADPRDPKFVVGYPIRGHDGLWYCFDADGELGIWPGGDPEKYIKEHPLPSRTNPTPEQIARLYAATGFGGPPTAPEPFSKDLSAAAGTPKVRKVKARPRL